jgi:hypothetical protein
MIRARYNTVAFSRQVPAGQNRIDMYRPQSLLMPRKCVKISLQKYQGR